MPGQSRPLASDRLPSRTSANPSRSATDRFDDAAEQLVPGYQRHADGGHGGVSGSWGETSPGEANTSPYTMLDLGQVNGMVALQQTLGVYLDHIVPSGAGKCELKVKADVSVEGVYGALELSLSAERDEEGFSLSGEVKFTLGVGVPADHLAITGTTGVSGKGNDAVEATNLCGMALERSIRPLGDVVSADTLRELVTKGIGGTIVSHTLGHTIANLLWGRHFDDLMLENMDDDDEARRTYSIGGEITGGVDDDTKLKGNADFHSDDVWTRGDDGHLQHEVDNQLDLTAGLTLELPGGEFSVKGSLEFPSTEEVIVGLTLGIGLEMGVEGTQAAIVGNGARQAVHALETIGKRLGERFFGEVATQVGDAVEAAMNLEEILTCNHLEVSGEYNSRTGVLTIDVWASRDWEVGETSPEGGFKVEDSRAIRAVHLTPNIGTI